MLLMSGSTCTLSTLTVAERSKQRGRTVYLDARHLTSKKATTRTTMDSPFLIDGLGIDPSLFEAPIHRLPPELLSYIFSFDDRTTDTFPTLFAWTVAHVCSQWRQVAFNTPRLWSTFAFDISSARSIDQRQLNSRLQLLDTCLTLSKSVPLDFVVALRGRKISACNAVLDRLCRHADRWRRAFFISSTDVLAPWIPHIRGHTPMLESLGFGSIDDQLGSVDLQKVFGTSAVSRLALASYHSEIGVLRAPWPQITSLKLISCPFNPLPAILNQLPNLTELEFEGELPRTGTLYSGHPIGLPKLLTLRITGKLNCVSKLLSILYTPKLVNLSIALIKSGFRPCHEDALNASLRDGLLSRVKKVKNPTVKFVSPDIEDGLWNHVIRYIQ